MGSYMGACIRSKFPDGSAEREFAVRKQQKKDVFAVYEQQMLIFVV